MSIIPDGTHIGSVTLKVKELDRAVRYYTETIGLRILSKNDSEAVLAADGVTPLVILEGNPSLEQRPVRSAGLYHLALLVPARKDLANVIQHFIKSNTRLVGGSNHLFSEAIYLQDPENNGIEIYRDVKKEDWIRDKEGNLLSASEPLDVQGLIEEADDVPWNGLPEKTTMGHVHLNVNNIASAEHFYVNVLGFEEQMRMGDHALFISAGGYHHHIALNTWNGREAISSPKGATGLRHYEIAVPAASDFESMKQKLNENQVPFTIEDEKLFLTDPAGNGIIIKHG